MRNATIIGIGAYAPKRIIDNKYFDEKLGENVSTWLESNVEIFKRHWCAADESTADLCEAAAKQALERSGVSADQLDLIIVSTDTPEFVSPSTASVLQDRLQAKKAGTFDVNTACAGFVTALDIGAKYIQSDSQYHRILVVGAYAMSKYLNPLDKKTVTLFADGAGAVVLEANTNTEKGFLGSELRTAGQYNEWMGIYGGAARYPTNSDSLATHQHQLQFVRKFPKELNPEYWSDMIINLCRRLEVEPADVDQFFITQININSIRDTMDILKLPHNKAHTVMHDYGYTGSACIPMAFNDAWEKGIVKSGDLVLFIGSGGGLAFASAAVRL